MDAEGMKPSDPFLQPSLHRYLRDQGIPACPFLIPPDDRDSWIASQSHFHSSELNFSKISNAEVLLFLVNVFGAKDLGK